MSGWEELVRSHDLKPHPEGGFFKEMYRSSSLTTIYFLLPPKAHSRWHVVHDLDEVWHLYSGTVNVAIYDPVSRKLEVKTLSSLNDRVAVVPAGCWQAAWPADEHDFSFVGCTVAPPFDFKKFSFVGDLQGHSLHFEPNAALHHLANKL
jgi:predicted cupin superfamily sugar epimerase